ncbi:hypothetical protein GIB67_005180, partial [Kingdonia uniflora]
ISLSISLSSPNQIFSSPNRILSSLACRFLRRFFTVISAVFPRGRLFQVLVVVVVIFGELSWRLNLL